MARKNINNHSYEVGEQILDTCFSIYENRGVPEHFNMTREIVQYDLTHGEANYRKLTTITEESPAKYIDELKKIGKNISKVVIKQVTLALGKALYNTSYLANNTKSGTGLAGEKLSEGELNKQVLYKGKLGYFGEIKVKISDLAADVYGIEKADSKMKKEVLSTLHALEGIFLEDGQGNGVKMLTIGGYSIDQKTRARVYRIFLHPVFAMNITKNFASHPQDIMKRLRESGRISELKLSLLDLLSLQRKDKPYIIYQSTLIEKIGFSEIYANQKKRTLSNLEDAIQAMKAIGMLKSYKEEKDSKGCKYTFYFNPKYVKFKEAEQAPEEELN